MTTGGRICTHYRAPDASSRVPLFPPRPAQCFVSFFYKLRLPDSVFHPNVILPPPTVSPELKKKLKRVLNDLLELAHPLGTDGTVNDLVVEAASDDDPLLPLDARGAILILDWDGNLLGAADSKDGSLRGVDDGGETFDSGVHAHVGDGDGAALVLLGLELVITSLLGKLLDGSRDGLQTLRLDVGDDGGDQAGGGGDGDGNVDVVELANDAITPRAVDGGDLLGGNGNGLDQEVVDGKLVPALGRAVESVAELEELADGEAGRDKVVGVVNNRGLETRSDGLAHAADRGVLVRGSRCSTGGGRGGLGLLDILLGDLATRASTLEALDRDTILNSKPLGGGRDVGLAIEGRLEPAAGSGRFGLGGRSGRRGRGGRLGLGLLLLLGSRGRSITTGILEREALKGTDVGSLVDQDGNWLWVGSMS